MTARKPALSAIERFERPLTTVDVAIFALTEDALQILLVRRPEGPAEPYPGHWALPGGFVDVDQDADLEGCALRKLREKTGVATPYLEQLGSWGSATRDPRGWSATHAYFALIAHVVLNRDEREPEARWFPIHGSGVRAKLAFDHADILATAVTRLRGKVEYTSLPAFLLPREFTLTELQRAYEIVLDRPLEKSAFRTRVLAADLVEPVGKLREGPNRPAQLYRIKQRRKPVFFARTFNPR